MECSRLFLDLQGLRCPDNGTSPSRYVLRGFALRPTHSASIVPHNVDADDERHVLLFSNVPIPGVIVESQLMSAKTKKSESRMALAIKVINEAVEMSGECTKAELAVALTGNTPNLDNHSNDRTYNIVNSVPKNVYNDNLSIMWGCSSSGRALQWH